MNYVLDTNVIRKCFNSYYRSCFPSLWKRFFELVNTGRITSTIEVLHELQGTSARDWANMNRHLFPAPNQAEAGIVRSIFLHQRFQDIVENRKLLEGGRNADVFIIARAKILDWTVVSNEIGKPGGCKIPNICRKYCTKCMTLEDFMKTEQWIF